MASKRLPVHEKFKTHTWGVTISCAAGRMVHGKPLYSAIKVTGNDPMFRLKPTSMSEVMKLPLITFKTMDISPNIWPDSLPLQLFANTEASGLNTDLFTDSENWGKSGENRWGNHVGDVTVVRQDHKVISVQQVEGLVEFANLMHRAFTSEVNEVATEAARKKGKDCGWGSWLRPAGCSHQGELRGLLSRLEESVYLYRSTILGRSRVSLRCLT